MTTTLSRDDVFRLPKADLHRHLDGAIRPELVIKLAKESGVWLPTYKLDKFTKLHQIVEPEDMLTAELLQRFAWAIAVMRTPYGLYLAAWEQVLDLARENILYAEIRFAPGYHSHYHAPWYFGPAYEKESSPVMSLDQAVWAVLSGLDRGMRETGIVVNLTLCIPRESLTMWGPKSVSDVVELALRFQNQGVVSVDLACNELAYPPDPYIEAFQSTFKSKLRRNPHAGEMGENPSRLQNIQTCIKDLRADGLGHAIPMYRSEYLIGMAREKNIRVERTPLSPVPGCSLADGRLDALLDYQVPVVITSDDPVLMRASLTDNWMAALNYHGFGEKEFWQMTANAVNTAFFRNEKERRRVQRRFVAKGLSPSLLAK